MIVCVCNNISDREIRQAVDLGISSMEELSRDLGFSDEDRVENIRRVAEVAKLMVDAGLMQKTDDDSLEDFRNVYDFKAAFETEYRIPEPA